MSLWLPLVPACVAWGTKTPPQVGGGNIWPWGQRRPHVKLRAGGIPLPGVCWSSKRQCTSKDAESQVRQERTARPPATYCQWASYSIALASATRLSWYGWQDSCSVGGRKELSRPPPPLASSRLGKARPGLPYAVGWEVISHLPLRPLQLSGP